MTSRTDRDWQLVDVLRRRDATAAECLVSTFGDRAYRLAIGIAGNHQDAEEAVQDAFWTVIHKIDTFRADAALGSWIYRITANSALQRRRRVTRRRDVISLDETIPAFHQDGRCESELRNALTFALQDLPDHYRAVTMLHDVEGLSMAEVAECLDITVATAKSRAHRARLLLRRRLAVFTVGATSAVEMAS